MNNRGGFTIVETLMVVAVTGVLLFSAMSAINGRQGRIAFSQGIREIDAQLRDVMNDVSIGYYPSYANLSCTVTGGADKPVIATSNPLADSTGRNEFCILAGKVIQYGTETEADQGRVYTVAGRRQYGSGVNRRDVRSIAEARPSVVGQVTEQFAIPSGIRTVRADQTDTGVALGIYYKNFGGTINTAATERVSAVSIARLNAGDRSVTQVTAAAEGVTDADFIANNASVIICFKSVTSREVAYIEIRGTSGGMTTETRFPESLSGISCA